MVEKFKKILNSVEAERGSVAIFALLKMDEFIDKWTVVISASWATDDNRAEVFELVRKKIIETLKPVEVAEIARIAIFPIDEHLIEELLQFKTDSVIENKQINGNTVHSAYIIKSEENKD
jgi:hypothetical protein